MSINHPLRTTILNVDDYEAGRYARSRTLQSAGFRVLEAETGGDALRLVQEEVPDLVLLDISLPDLDGREVCRRLRDNPRTVALPVLQISSVYTGEQARVSGLEAGGDAFLPGDVGSSELIATVRALLRLRQAKDTTPIGVARPVELVETLREPIVQLDAEGRCAYLNPAAEALLGRVRGALLGRLATDAMPEFFPPIAQEELRRARETGQDARYDQWVGELNRWFAVHAEPSPGGIVVRLRDVTEQRAAMTALKASEEHLRRALAAGQIGTWKVDESLVSAEIDRMECELLGLPPETRQVPVERVLSLVHPDDRERLWQVVQEARAASGEYSVEFRIPQADGSVRWLATRARWQRSDDGSPARLYGVHFDVTERHRAAEALEELVRQKDQFLSVLSHELRNPLSAILGANHLLMRQPSVEQCTRLAARIDRQTRHLSRLVDDLLDVARIGQGKLELRRERVRLQTIVNAALEAVQPMVDEREHQVTLELPERSIELEADPARLQQIIANLLSNAARYTEQGGKIRVNVRVDPANHEVWLRVQDSGIGIPADALARIWEVFVQADASRTRSSGGLGIGLHLVRALVREHGGDVEAFSQGPGHGSEFVVRLPLPPA